MAIRVLADGAWGFVSTGNLDTLEKGVADATSMAKAAENVILQLEGVAAKGGLFPCVMGPRVVGTLAHEALEDLAEADLTVNSPFRGKRGEVVASEGVNMTDDGTNAGKVGVSKYDDEGVPSSRVEIIKDSVLKELLINRESLLKLDNVPLEMHVQTVTSIPQ